MSTSIHIHPGKDRTPIAKAICRLLTPRLLQDPIATFELHGNSDGEIAILVEIQSGLDGPAYMRQELDKILSGRQPGMCRRPADMAIEIDGEPYVLPPLALPTPPRPPTAPTPPLESDPSEEQAAESPEPGIEELPDSTGEAGTRAVKIEGIDWRNGRLLAPGCRVDFSAHVRPLSNPPTIYLKPLRSGRKGKPKLAPTSDSDAQISQTLRWMADQFDSINPANSRGAKQRRARS